MGEESALSVKLENEREENLAVVARVDESAKPRLASRLVDLSIAVPLAVIEVVWICALAILVQRLSGLL